VTRVREAGPADHGRVRALLRDAGLPLDGLDDARAVLVAEGAGRVVGCVALERHGDAVLLRSAAVEPGARGWGAGTALVQAALARAAGSPVALLTETASGWFARFGFHEVERAALPAALRASAELQGACPASAVAMLRGAPAG
jgi:amino-acid N-acetyltransferase